jgi:hypothetical protein
MQGYVNHFAIGKFAVALFGFGAIPARGYWGGRT